jgi:DNA end-binding protein Ku
VPWEEIVKGYEYEDGRYVVMSEEDFRRANPEATQTVDIQAFVDIDQIPPMYFETPYYLAPGKRGEKGYALLRETLKKSGKAGIATFVIRSKQHLAVVAAVGEMLVLDTLRHADEIRSMDEFELPSDKDVKLSPKEVEMALRLVEGMAEEWQPEKYHDTYREDILARVEEKIKAGQTKVITEPDAAQEQPQGAEIIDLMALLKRSIETKGKDRAAAPTNKGEQRAGRPAKRAAASKSGRGAPKTPAAGERRKHA